MSKYWHIKTSGTKYVNAFSSLISKGVLIGEIIHVLNEYGSNYVIDAHNTKLLNIRGDSASRQYIKAWQGLGFIRELSSNSYMILTDFTDFNDLVDHSKIHLFHSTGDKNVDKYRFTMKINIRAAAGQINDDTLEIEGISKSRGKLTMKDIAESIGDYENEMLVERSVLQRLGEENDK